MKHFNTSMLALAVTSGLLLTPEVGSVERTLVIEGPVTETEFANFRSSLTVLDGVSTISRFRLVYVYDDQLMHYSSQLTPTSELISFINIGSPERALKSIAFEFLDGEGEVVPQQTVRMEHNRTPKRTGAYKWEFTQVDDLDDDPLNDASDERLNFDYNYEAGELWWYSYERNICLNPVEDGRCYANWIAVDVTNEGDAPLMFADSGAQLTPVHYQNEPRHAIRFYLRGMTVDYRTQQDHYTVGFDSHVDAMYFDADLDGVADHLDECSMNGGGETVIFNGYDSGVTNHTTANGCSVMDYYQACETSPQNYFSGPSYCETQVAYTLYAQGVIDYSEVRALRTALSRAYR